MSSRRKRAPPVRVDEEAKKRMNWNMLEDRKREVLEGDEGDGQIPSCSLLPADPTPVHSAGEENAEASCSIPPTLPEQGEELPSTSLDAPPPSAPLALSVVPVSNLDHLWKALIGEFSIRPSWFPSDCEQRAFTLHRMGEQLCLTFSCQSQEDQSSRMEAKSVEETCTAECSLSRILVEDLDWLQKRRVVQLCHQAKEDPVKARMIENIMYNAAFDLQDIYLTIDA